MICVDLRTAMTVLYGMALVTAFGGLLASIGCIAIGCFHRRSDILGVIDAD